MMKNNLSINIIFSIVTFFCSEIHAAKTVPIENSIDNIINKIYPSIETIYKYIHAHPELAFQEHKTAALLASKMRSLGFEVTENIGKTGIVAIYKNGAGPVVLVRTELDGLPMQEKTGLPYSSKQRAIVDEKTVYTAHSCGHDNHMAWWIGAAETLIKLKKEWKGTLMFVGQPAEESVSGAQAMLDDGLFHRFPKPDYAFAAHITNNNSDTVIIKDGIVSSNSDEIEIIFKGFGGHGSQPHKTIDPVIMGTQFVNTVQTIISRKKDANAFGVITVGSFQSGTVGNIIPDEAVLKLTVRSFTKKIRKLLFKEVKNMAESVAMMHSAPVPEIRITSSTGAVYNDHKLSRLVFSKLVHIGNNMKVEFIPATEPGISASEDFSVFSDAGIPCVYMSIGGYDNSVINAFKKQGKYLPTNHSPYFSPNHKQAILMGIRVLTIAVLSVTKEL